MSELAPTYALWAAAIGALSAVSLPLGSAIGLAFRPRPVLTATLAAFGAGALIAALSVELVAPAASALVDGEPGHGAVPRSAFLALLLGGAIQLVDAADHRIRGPLSWHSCSAGPSEASSSSCSTGSSPSAARSCARAPR